MMGLISLVYISSSEAAKAQNYQKQRNKEKIDIISQSTLFYILCIDAPGFSLKKVRNSLTAT